MLRPSKMASVCSALLLLAASASSRPSDSSGGEGANGDPCLLPSETGRCRAGIRAFHFNPESKRCEMFIYGGCDGNDNRFSTLKDCHESCKHHLEDPADFSVHLKSNRCSQHPLLGRRECRGYFPRFTFDPQSLKCVSYIYGGCNAGDNLFATAGECTSACVVGAEAPTFGSKVAQLSRGLPLAPHGLNPVGNKSSDVDICLLPPTGDHLISCLAYIEKWTFDSSKDACIHYIYGGCYGTENLFDSKEDCEERCKARSTEASVTFPDELQEPPRACFETLSNECPTGEIGRLHYGYNADKGTCVPYEACQGEGFSELGNSFDTAKECLRVCNPRKYKIFYAEERSPDACSLEIDTGPCRMAIPAYAFNTKTKRCEKFFYGGCEGNANRFASVEECVNTCGGNSPPSLDARCSQVTCNKNEIMFYEAKACKPITRPGDCCPSSWDCSLWNERKNRKGECFFANADHPNGKYYAPGSPVPEAEGGCRAGCFCRNEGVISCAVVDCFPFRKNGQSEKCFQIYDDRESCCSSTSACFDGDVPYLCELEGKSYIEGQIMHSISDPCNKCQCKKGWNGTVSSDFCSPVDCGFVTNDMYLQMECQPIFRDGVCCPVQWICPKDMTLHSGKNNSLPPPITSVPNADCPPGVQRLPVRAAVANSIDSHLYFELAKGFPKHLRKDTFPSLKPSDVCLLPPPEGPCEGFKESWYFDIGQRKCKMFKYGGSDDQVVLLNVFESQQECQDLCRDYLVDSFHGPSCEEATLDKEGPQMPDRCLLPGRQFKFDQENNKCIETSHMGCTANRDKSFGSIDECEAKCVTVSEPPSQIGLKFAGKDPICNDPVVIGRCKARLQRFYYDPATGLCNKFFYGGCGGSENNFVEKSECISRCVNIDNEARALVPQELHLSNPCDHMPEQGRCRARKPRYYHDPVTRQCKLFIYGGCGGNENNFENLSDCMERCEVDVSVQEQYRAVCDEPHDQGQSCAEADRSSMWYFDSDADDCLSFDFNGCGGNGNRFSSRDVCRLTCKLSGDDDNEDLNVGGFGRSIIAEPSPREFGGVPEICLQPVKVGMCRALIPRFFYNKKNRKCEDFNFGGCDANDNNFETIEDCRKSCENFAISSSTRSLSDLGQSRHVQLPSDLAKPAQLPANNGEGATYLSLCELRPDPGRCYAYFPSFYFNKDSGSCEQFVYGGCGGNANRFQTEEECEHRCSGGQRQRLSHSRSSSPITEDDGSLNPEDECRFGNSTFKRGDVIRSLATGCRSCTCSSPPYLTCIEKTCPEWKKVSEDSSESSSEEDDDDCRVPVYDEDDCCITSYRCEEN